MHCGLGSFHPNEGMNDSNEFTDKDFDDAGFDFSDYEQPFHRNRQRLAQLFLLILWIVFIAVVMA